MGYAETFFQEAAVRDHVFVVDKMLSDMNYITDAYLSFVSLNRLIAWFSDQLISWSWEHSQ